MPGRYKVAVKVPGVAAELHGEILVEGDPLTNFSDADRRARQALVMGVFGLQKTLVAAHNAARAINAQSADLRKDLAAGGAKTDSLMAHISRIQSDVDRILTTTNGSMRTIEGWSGPATADQRRQIDFANEDATKAINELNRMISIESPDLYAAAAKQPWPKPVVPVSPPKK